MDNREEKPWKTVLKVLAIAFVVVFVIPTVLGLYILLHDGSVTRQGYKVPPAAAPLAGPVAQHAPIHRDTTQTR
jgi:hypothetical protein